MLQQFYRAASIYRGLPKDIYFLAIARFIVGMGSFIFLFLMLLLTEKLGYSTTAAGALATGLTGIILAGNFVGGKLADMYGHKRVLVAGELTGSIILIICGFYSDAPVLVPVLLFMTFFLFGIAFPASTALVADLSTPKNRDAMMSLSYLAFNLGSAVGPLIAGYLFWNYTRWIFFANGLAVLTGIIIVMFFIHATSETTQENQDEADESDSLEKPVSGSVWSVLKDRPRIPVFALLTGFLWFAQNQMTVANPLYLNYLFGTDGPVILGQLMAFACVIVVFGTPVLIKLTQSKTGPFSLALSGVLFGLGYALIVWQPTVPAHYLAWLLMAAGEILLVTKEAVYLANQSPASHRGRIQGTMATMQGILRMPGFVLTGWLIDHYGYHLMWSVVIFCCLSATAGLLTLDRQQNRQRPKTTLLSQ
ncbi:putative 3-hydroxyphenylpropionic transporter MhpT [Vibrio aerogenes CECT 7868]|uniref:Putative 3-hydroxyphenylpropionic transporter MhpT n=1 Tax=Vibrio aerogenes CECT 7868 TaxID=1216006 RepID=A0A1M5X2I0_9VIBR|nr:MFS transporter [Vibrio aerogenes]SHH94067.1 putative 3-hydroxyphenylpropionic transporter MhpT [Vibrio aerogenes CECT 7868]